MLSFDFDDNKVTLKDGTEGEVVGYVGSDIFRVKYRKNNNTFIMGYNARDLKFSTVNVEYLKRKFSK